MRLLESIENKIKLALTVALCSLIVSVIIAVYAMHSAGLLVREAQESIYVLDGTTPLRASRMPENRPAEYAAHVERYHELFFSLPPDDAFIKRSLERAMYLIDESGVREYNTLKEKGYYNQILSSSAVLSVQMDSVRMQENSFTYYGLQRIERGSRIQYRRLITTGRLQEVPRSENNPHGLLITGWKTLDNQVLRDEIKRAY